MTNGKRLDRIRQARTLKERLADAALKRAALEVARLRGRQQQAMQQVSVTMAARLEHRVLQPGEELSADEVLSRQSTYQYLQFMERRALESEQSAREEIQAAEAARKAASERLTAARNKRERVDEIWLRHHGAELTQQQRREEDEAAENHQALRC